MKLPPDILALKFRGITTAETNMIAQDCAVANPAS
jgi:hypothetical protein